MLKNVTAITKQASKSLLLLQSSF